MNKDWVSIRQKSLDELRDNSIAFGKVEGAKQELEKWNKFIQYLDITCDDPTIYKERLIKALNKRLEKLEGGSR